jgi:hypothetical protein
MMSEDKPVYVGPYYGLMTCNSGDDGVAVLEISAKLLPSGFGGRSYRSVPRGAKLLPAIGCVVTHVVTQDSLQHHTPRA